MPWASCPCFWGLPMALSAAGCDRRRQRQHQGRLPAQPRGQGQLGGVAFGLLTQVRLAPTKALELLADDELRQKYCYP